jgi:hypothetical protein
MNDLALHIETLLLDNDCVIVPDFGGFVAHYVPSVYVEEEQLFLPPSRSIGFNPLLKMNDGLLAQSYMALYGTNFADATRIIERGVDELKDTLSGEGKVYFSNIGEVTCNIHGIYDFAPDEHRLATPALFGLDAFSMKALPPLPKKQAQKVPTAKAKTKLTHRHRLRRSVPYVATVAICFILLFFLSTPIDNNQSVSTNYAQLNPIEWMTHVPAPTPVPPPLPTQKAVQEPAQGMVGSVAQAERHYHIIVASGISMRNAERFANNLLTQGYAEAHTLTGEGKIRVSLCSYETKAEAYEALNQLRKNEAFANAWVLRR